MITGLEGADYIDAGIGDDDTVDFSAGTTGLKIDLSLTQTIGTAASYRVQDDGFGNQEYIDGVENVIGTSLDDTIIGNSVDNKLEAGSGADTPYGVS